MEIILPSFKVLDDVDGIKILKSIEKAARVCYKSEDRITEDSYKPFIEKVVLGNNHESVIEHEKVSVALITNRGVTHELVRHKLCAPI